MYFNMSLSSLQVRLFPRENPLSEGLDCQLSASARAEKGPGNRGAAAIFLYRLRGRKGGEGGGSKSATAS